MGSGKKMAENSSKKNSWISTCLKSGKKWIRQHTRKKSVDLQDETRFKNVEKIQLVHHNPLDTSIPENTSSIIAQSNAVEKIKANELVIQKIEEESALCHPKSPDNRCLENQQQRRSEEKIVTEQPISLIAPGCGRTCEQTSSVDPVPTFGKPRQTVHNGSHVPLYKEKPKDAAKRKREFRKAKKFWLQQQLLDIKYRNYRKIKQDVARKAKKFCGKQLKSAHENKLGKSEKDKKTKELCDNFTTHDLADKGESMEWQVTQITSMCEQMEIGTDQNTTKAEIENTGTQMVIAQESLVRTNSGEEYVNVELQIKTHEPASTDNENQTNSAEGISYDETTVTKEDSSAVPVNSHIYSQEHRTRRNFYKIPITDIGNKSNIEGKNRHDEKIVATDDETVTILNAESQVKEEQYDDELDLNECLSKDEAAVANDASTTHSGNRNSFKSVDNNPASDCKNVDNEDNGYLSDDSSEANNSEETVPKVIDFENSRKLSSEFECDSSSSSDDSIKPEISRNGHKMRTEKSRKKSRRSPISSQKRKTCFELEDQKTGRANNEDDGYSSDASSDTGSYTSEETDLGGKRCKPSHQRPSGMNSDLLSSSDHKILPGHGPSARKMNSKKKKNKKKKKRAKRSPPSARNYEDCYMENEPVYTPIPIQLAPALPQLNTRPSKRSRRKVRYNPLQHHRGHIISPPSARNCEDCYMENEPAYVPIPIKLVSALPQLNTGPSKRSRRKVRYNPLQHHRGHIMQRQNAPIILALYYLLPPLYVLQNSSDEIEERRERNQMEERMERERSEWNRTIKDVMSQLIKNSSPRKNVIKRLDTKYANFGGTSSAKEKETTTTVRSE